MNKELGILPFAAFFAFAFLLSMFSFPDETALKREKIYADFGEEFMLRRGQEAVIKGYNISLILKGFIYSPCPEGSQCIWSGLAATYELIYEGRIYEAPLGYLPPDAPLSVFIKESDYKTYAVFLIEPPASNN